ncbi:phosphoglycolate phosphatase [Rhodobacteraceae bacterium CCMM004]|nr:phosphoglycolate phosphatase [Rhodobacteraceae bacterium CCMM004]
MTYATVVFDLDGTLIDSAPDLQTAANAALAHAGRAPIDLATTIGFIGDGVEMLVRRALRARHHPGDDVAGPLAAFHAAYDRCHAERTRPYPGALALLDRLAAAGVPMGLCTNKPEGPARDICAALGLTGFGVVVGGDTLGVKKPDPAPLLHAIDALGGERRTTLYVGDSGVDRATAAAAGVPFALVAGGYLHGPLEGPPPEHRLDRIAEVADLTIPAHGRTTT